MKDTHGELRLELRLDRPLAPERALALGILEDVLHVVLRDDIAPADPRRRRLFEEARDWIMCDDRESPFSFLTTCEVLEIDPAALRAGLRLHFTCARLRGGWS